MCSGKLRVNPMWTHSRAGRFRSTSQPLHWNFHQQLMGFDLLRISTRLPMIQTPPYPQPWIKALQLTFFGSRHKHPQGMKQLLPFLIFSPCILLFCGSYFYKQEPVGLQKIKFISKLAENYNYTFLKKIQIMVDHKNLLPKIIPWWAFDVYQPLLIHTKIPKFYPRLWAFLAPTPLPFSQWTVIFATPYYK